MFPSSVVGYHRSGEASFRLGWLSSDPGEAAILSLFRIPVERVAPDFSRTRSAENIFAPALPAVQKMGPETADTVVQAGPHGLLFRASDLGFRLEQDAQLRGRALGVSYVFGKSN